MHLRCRDKTLDLSHPVVMGVLNVTPDSFSDGGQFVEREAAIEHGARMAQEGAAIIDVGGESTRPGAEPVEEALEVERVVPVIEGLAARVPDCLISVDTSKPGVMREAVHAGAHLINDVRGLRGPGAVEAAAESGAAVCLMHMQGEPRTMQDDPRYDDVVAEVEVFLRERAVVCEDAGIPRERLALDPGFGFGKTLEHNLTLLRSLDAFAGLGRPIVAGLSRKSMIGHILGRPPDSRLHGSLALAALAVWQGAAIVRAHDVAPTVEAVAVAAAVRAAGAGAGQGPAAPGR